MWNKLPEDVVDLATNVTFKRHLDMDGKQMEEHGPGAGMWDQISIVAIDKLGLYPRSVTLSFNNSKQIMIFIIPGFNL